MERELHHWLQSIPTSFNTYANDSLEELNVELELGIGDDAAVINLLHQLSPSSNERSKRINFGSIVLTTDTLAEGTHFDLKLHSLEMVGRKSLAINLSDIAAMGAKPIAALLTLVLPQKMVLSDVKRLVEGCLKLAKQYQIDLIGGDTNVWSGNLIVGLTAVGVLPFSGNLNSSRAWRLSGAEVGDQIFVSGRFGGSILGHHLTFQPRIELARYLQANYPIKAATDVSDSLSLDLDLMARASGKKQGANGNACVGVEIDPDLIPIAQSAEKLSKTTGNSALFHALTDGEDFELLIAVDNRVADRILDDTHLKELLQSIDEERGQFTRIGQFIDEAGFFLLQQQRRVEFPVKGYSH